MAILPKLKRTASVVTSVENFYIYPDCSTVAPNISEANIAYIFRKYGKTCCPIL